MTKELAIKNDEFIFEPEHLTKETIKKYLCPKATDQELMLGLQIAKTFKLNPLKREVYFVKYKEDQPMQVLTGYEVYLKRAERSGKYNGMEVTSEGSVANGDLKAIVKVYRKDWTNPLTHEAFYSEYVQMKKDFNSGKESPNKFWATKPITMIKKVAVSQAFRFAFPDEFDGMPYTTDEVVDQERVIDIQTHDKNVSETLQNGSGSTIEAKADTSTAQVIKDPKDIVYDTDNDPISADQGASLLELGKANGKGMKEIKEYILFTWEMKSIKELKNKHLVELKAYLTKKDA